MINICKNTKNESKRKKKELNLPKIQIKELFLFSSLNKTNCIEYEYFFINFTIRTRESNLTNKN